MLETQEPKQATHRTFAEIKQSPEQGWASDIQRPQQQCASDAQGPLGSGLFPEPGSSTHKKMEFVCTSTTIKGTDSRVQRTKAAEQEPSQQTVQEEKEEGPKVSHQVAKPPHLQWTLSKSGALSSSSTDMSNVKKLFIQIAQENRMSVLRNLDNVVTVKCIQDSIGCLFKNCLPLGWDRTVYQLEKSSQANETKLRLVFISGDYPSFEQFSHQFHHRLWTTNILELQPLQVIRLLCLSHNHLIQEARNAYQRAYTHCDPLKTEALDKDESAELLLMDTFQKAVQEMRGAIFDAEKGISCTAQNMELLVKHLLTLVPVEDYYIRSRMRESSQVQQVRRTVQNDHTIGHIFHYLEIETQFMPIIEEARHKSIKAIKEEGGTLPLQEALLALDALNFGECPKRNCETVAHFIKGLLQGYQAVGKLKESVLDMDSQLPLTIYCLLGCTNTQLEPLVCFLEAYLNKEEGREKEKRTLAALKASLQFLRLEWNLKQ